MMTPEPEIPAGTVVELQEKYLEISRQVHAAVARYKSAMDQESAAKRELELARARAYLQAPGNQEARKAQATLDVESEQQKYDILHGLRMSAEKALHTWREELRTINGLAWAHKAEADLHRG